MKSQAIKRPEMVQKLDSKNYAFNYNIVEKNNDEGTYYEYDQIIVNSSTVNQNDITRNTIISNFDINQQFKLINDYMAFKLGLVKDVKYKERYEDFLRFRIDTKLNIDNNVLNFNL